MFNKYFLKELIIIFYLHIADTFIKKIMSRVLFVLGNIVYVVCQ